MIAVVDGVVTKEQINSYMKSVANESYGYNEDEIVSSDVIGMRYGSLFDATQTMVTPVGENKTQVQVVHFNAFPLGGVGIGDELADRRCGH